MAEEIVTPPKRSSIDSSSATSNDKSLEKRDFYSKSALLNALVETKGELVEVSRSVFNSMVDNMMSAAAHNHSMVGLSPMQRTISIIIHVMIMCGWYGM